MERDFGALAPLFGFVLQYLRARKWYADWMYVVTVVVLTGLGVALTVREWPPGWQDRVFVALDSAWRLGTMIAGGTMTAKLVSKVNSSVPQTNSK